MNKLSLLVVEDDLEIQDFVVHMLRQHRIKFDLVSSAEDALMMLASCNYSIVIVSLVLPDMDGWMLLETIRRQPRTAHLPCIAVTTHHYPGIDLEALQAGFAAYFFKPFDSSVFINTVQDVLNWTTV